MFSFLKKLVNWFLGKAPSKLEVFQEEVIKGKGVELIRYRRKQLRAYRTWRAIYKQLEYDIVMGWDTLEVIVGIESPPKKNKLSTHILSIYKQGLHARWNPMRGCHEPDITVLVKEQEVCLDPFYLDKVLKRWRVKNNDGTEERVLRRKEDVFDFIIDQVALYLIRHPPSEVNPMKINWLSLVEETTRHILGSDTHQVFPVVRPKTSGFDFVD